MPSANLSPVLDAERRSWAYWSADGLPNLTAGLSCILLSTGFLLLTWYKHAHSALLLTTGAIAVLLFIVIFFRLRQSLEWLKSKITYPRTGYASSPYFTFAQNQHPPADLTMLNLSPVERPGILLGTAQSVREAEDRHWQLWVTFGIYLAALLCAALVRQEWICAALGVAAGIGIWLSTRKNERKSWTVAFGLPFAGIYLFILAGTNLHEFQVQRLSFFLGGAGLVLATDGAIALAGYLRRNPLARA
jgi:hypothetical protein